MPTTVAADGFDPSRFRVADRQQLQMIIDAFGAIAWPARADDVIALCQSFGWQRGGPLDRPRYPALSHNLGLTGDHVRIWVSRRSGETTITHSRPRGTSRAYREAGELQSLTMEVSDDVPRPPGTDVWARWDSTPDQRRALAIRDGYIQLKTTLTELLWKPNRATAGPHAAASWDLASGGMLTLSALDTVIILTLDSEDRAEASRYDKPGQLRGPVLDAILASMWVACDDDVAVIVRGLQQASFPVADDDVAALASTLGWSFTPPDVGRDFKLSIPGATSPVTVGSTYGGQLSTETGVTRSGFSHAESQTPDVRTALAALHRQYVAMVADLLGQPVSAGTNASGRYTVAWNLASGHQFRVELTKDVTVRCVVDDRLEPPWSSFPVVALPPPPPPLPRPGAIFAADPAQGPPNTTPWTSRLPAGTGPLTRVADVISRGDAALVGAVRSLESDPASYVAADPDSDWLQTVAREQPEGTSAEAVYFCHVAAGEYLIYVDRKTRVSDALGSVRDISVKNGYNIDMSRLNDLFLIDEETGEYDYEVSADTMAGQIVSGLEDQGFAVWTTYFFEYPTLMFVPRSDVPTIAGLGGAAAALFRG